ncbi:hypothetical protein SGCOL_011141, partial [Colletotrichum sp. CLE4]
QVTRLAKNLYSSKARFVFELLQNADDNNYAEASTAGSKPFVSFRIFPRKVVVKCNEDGFSQDNLKAICAVGQSSKTGSQATSARRALASDRSSWLRIKCTSNPFSFSFRHEPEDSGTGMISPTWEETSEKLQSPLTRITLHLHDTGDEGGLAKTRESIRSQFEMLQAKMLPFLRNIRRIQIGFFDDDGKEASSVTYDLTQLEPSHVLLKKIKTEKAASEEFVQHFTIISHTAKGLAKNENRTYTKSEGASQAYSKSEVVLAFPISEKSVPIIEPQQVYAFLPVRPVGFNFLIQADFVTEASRQDIVKDSLCNLGLLKAIAEAFPSAATELSEHEALRYTWPAYLPNTTGSWDMFWLSLVDEIRTSLQKAPAFYDHKGYGWRLLRDLLHATSDMFDENQKLLLEDGDPAEVILRQYGSTDIKILKSYGLCDVTPARFRRWLGADLANGITSRMQSQGTTDLWHEQTAAISNFALNHRTVRGFHGPKIKDMDLVPLEGGSWTSASLGPIYLPTVKGLDIPVNLGMGILSRRVEGEKRSLLVNSLGVKCACGSCATGNFAPIHRC